MSMNPYQQAASNYKSTELKSEVNEASPHKLIDMLLAGAKSHISSAKVCMENDVINKKGEHISKAISIIGGLLGSLDKEKGGDLALRLENLYKYTELILLKANVENDQKLLDEAFHHLDQIHEGWKQIDPDLNKNE